MFLYKKTPKLNNKDTNNLENKTGQKVSIDNITKENIQKHLNILNIISHQGATN